MTDVVKTVESKSVRLLGIMVGTMCHGNFGKSVPRCHHMVVETAGTIQEPALQPVRVVGAMKPLRCLGRRGRCSSLHLDHVRRILIMAD
jgi:hypothetical protein